MPRSVSGTLSSTPAHRRQQGFTLLEILVVMFLIALSVSMARVAFSGGDDKRLTDAAERFAATARFMSEQSVLGGERVALFVTREASGPDERWCYRWQRHRDSAWEPASDFVEPRCFPPGAQLDMLVEGEPYEYDPRQTVELPVLIFFPSGEATPFELALFKDAFSDDVQRVEIDIMAGVRWRNQDKETEYYER